MSGKISVRAAALFITLLSAGLSSYAQSGAPSAYSPYSIFGVGDMVDRGNTYNKAMGGTGIASRNKKVINTLNPAAVTARDSLSFMWDFSLSQNNQIYRQGDLKSANNNTNINDITISFPIYRTLAFMAGVAPYSSVGYDFTYIEENEGLISQTGNIGQISNGTGSLYQVFTAAGVTFWKKLSLGVEWIHYFGEISKSSIVTFSNSTYNGLSSGNELKLRANTAKFGLQYEQPVGKYLIGLGATYSLSARLKGEATDYKISTGSVVYDTLRYNVSHLTNDKVYLQGEIGAGISFRNGEKWRAEIDYLQSDWTNSGMDRVEGFANVSSSSFTATQSRSIRGGFELVPNINDVRYYLKRCSYRAGAYYKNSYFLLDGKAINSVGITLGMSFPVFKYYNALSFAVDFGQRGSLTGNMIRERYVNFTIGLNAFDIWFQKPRYY